MNRFMECCAGIDVGKKEIAVTLLTGAANEEPVAETKTYGTTMADLQACREWLRSKGCPSVVLESTGSYWIPVWNVLQEGLAVIVANAEHVKARRGEKTDPLDSQRLAEKLRVGDVRGSFVPPENVQELRDLTRRRKKVLSAANAERNRVQKLLERANVKMGNVIRDIFGVSGQQILKTLLEHPERTAAEMAEMAKGRLRSKIPELAATLEGHRLNEHLRWMIQQSLDHLMFLEKQLGELAEMMQHKLKRWEKEYELLQTIPGVGAEIAAVILAETGGNMKQFPSDRHLTSWAGVCPGNHSSAGKRKSASIKRANPWLMSALIQAGWGAARQRDSIFKKRFYRWTQHRGKKKAVVATARAVLATVWHVLSTATPYREPSHPEMERREVGKKVLHHLRNLRRLGVDISGVQIPPGVLPEGAPKPGSVRPSVKGALGIHAR